MMRIIRPDGSIEEIPDNYRHRWSPAEILAIELPPENRPLIGSEQHPRRRQSPAEAKADTQKGATAARKARADKRKRKPKTEKL